jgi:hypothetical protein
VGHAKFLTIAKMSTGGLDTWEFGNIARAQKPGTPPSACGKQRLPENRQPHSVVVSASNARGYVIHLIASEYWQ